MVIEGKRWLAQFDCDWLQFLRVRQWNWVTFRFVSFEAEWEQHLGSVEASAALLGFRVRVSYTYDDSTPLRESLHAQLDDMMARAHVSVPVPEWDAVKADAAKWRALQVPVESLGREA